METMERLAKRVKEAAAAITSLKKEKHALEHELRSSRDRAADYHTLYHENQVFRRDRDRLRLKLERLNKKLEKLLAPAAEPVERNGGMNHEERPE